MASPANIDALNASVVYTCWSVFARTGTGPDLAAVESGISGWMGGLAASGVTLRGLYDVSAMRADADLMVWLVAPSAAQLQASVRSFRRSPAGLTSRLAWSAMGTHRPAEFSRDHVPSFMLGTQPLDWLTVYPFVRSHEWYLLPADERREMLREHGLAGRAFPGVQANTVAAFTLTDYEWLLALESNNLHDLVDMMRDLRATQARRHVREETPFHSGRLVDAAEAADLLR